MSFLKRPYPFDTALKKDLLTNALIALFTALFLVVFQPFEINLWQTEHKTLKLFGFGAVSFIIPTVINLTLLLFFDTAKLEERWVVWKEILLLLIVLAGIALGNLLFAYGLHIADLRISNFLTAMIVTVAVGVFPVTASVALKHGRYRRLNAQKAKELEEELVDFQQKIKPQNQEPSPALPLETTAVHRLQLIAENEKDRFEIAEDQLIYIESTDNYSTIVYLDETFKRQKHLIRSSLKRLEQQIGRPQILRCHRSYIVNLMAVEHVEGNAQGYRLRFHLVEDQIPVARAYGKEILSRLQAKAPHLN